MFGYGTKILIQQTNVSGNLPALWKVKLFYKIYPTVSPLHTEVTVINQTYWLQNFKIRNSHIISTTFAQRLASCQMKGLVFRLFFGFGFLVFFTFPESMSVRVFVLFQALSYREFIFTGSYGRSVLVTGFPASHGAHLHQGFPLSSWHHVSL